MVLRALCESNKAMNEMEGTGTFTPDAERYIDTTIFYAYNLYTNNAYDAHKLLFTLRVFYAHDLYIYTNCLSTCPYY